MSDTHIINNNSDNYYVSNEKKTCFGKIIGVAYNNSTLVNYTYYKDSSDGVATDICGGSRAGGRADLISSGTYSNDGTITFDDESTRNTSKAKVIDALKEGTITYSATGSEFVDWELVGGKYQLTKLVVTPHEHTYTDEAVDYSDTQHILPVCSHDGCAAFKLADHTYDNDLKCTACGHQLTPVLYVTVNGTRKACVDESAACNDIISASRSSSDITLTLNKDVFMGGISIVSGNLTVDLNGLYHIWIWKPYYTVRGWRCKDNRQ